MVPPERSTDYPPAELFWLGDAAGFELEAAVDPYSREPYVIVSHRCGWSARLEGAQAYLGNMIDELVSPHRRTGCRDWDV